MSEEYSLPSEPEEESEESPQGLPDYVEESLERAIMEIMERSGRIQAQGRRLSRREETSIEILDRARELLDEAIRTLAQLPGKDRRKKNW